MAKKTEKKDNRGQQRAAEVHARNEARKADKEKAPKSPVPDAETRNRDNQTVATPEEEAARKAAPAIVDAVAKAIKDGVTAGTTQPAGDGSFDTTPTPTQLVEEARKPLDAPKTEELKIVRTGSLPGQPTTTLKEELKVVDKSVLSGDKEKDANTLAVLARTQGINQYADGKVVGQQGDVIASDDEIEGEKPKSLEERAAA